MLWLPSHGGKYRPHVSFRLRQELTKMVQLRDLSAVIPAVKLRWRWQTFEYVFRYNLLDDIVFVLRSAVYKDVRVLNLSATPKCLST
jgi:hypothetical protein